MSNKNYARRTVVKLYFKGADISKELSKYLLSLSFTDKEEDETDDIRKTMYTMLEMAVRLEKKYHKKTTLQDLDIEVDVLRNLLRLAKDPNLYPNQKPCLDFHTWEVWMRKVDEIGRMIGGYTEWVNGREKQK